MAWIVLLISGLLETVWAVALARSDGFSKPAWVGVFLVAAAASLAGLTYALRELPVGTAYAVWTGMGAAGTAVVGMALLGEPVQVARILCVLLIVVAVVGLQLTSSHA
jgi:quaternary ammonium compound-resistance protein SugE